MRVLILGGGSVGSAVARRQRLQSREVTVVERDPVKAKILDDELDVRVICDEASRASALFRANASSMDFCFALTGDDETNILGASVAKAMGARRVAARVYSPVFRDLGTFDYARHFNVDRLLSIEHL
ncbi:MAG: NAD-binding protein, partial [Thermoguttaceae bacterium]|nr:NAD-binding protein [Thermoguttaceae bacterium]